MLESNLQCGYIGTTEVYVDTVPRDEMLTYCYVSEYRYQPSFLYLNRDKQLPQLILKHQLTETNILFSIPLTSIFHHFSDNKH